MRSDFSCAYDTNRIEALVFQKRKISHQRIEAACCICSFIAIGCTITVMRTHELISASIILNVDDVIHYYRPEHLSVHIKVFAMDRNKFTDRSLTRRRYCVTERQTDGQPLQKIFHGA